jgi:phosphoglucosamine mutase
VVIDCANGAAYKAAPEVLWELGAEVIPVGVAPNGTNINDRCGSTHTETAAEAVVAHGAHVGIALDGDADRVMILDETGRWPTATRSWRFWPPAGPRGGCAAGRWWRR